MKTEDVLYDEVFSDNKKKLDTLRNELAGDREWALCLGAGVSISAGLPNWYGLLAKLTAQIVPQENFKKISEGDMDIPYYQGVENFYKNLKDENNFYKKSEKALNDQYQHVFEGINVLESAEYIRNYLKDDVRRMLGGDEWKEKLLDHRLNCFIQNICRNVSPVSPDSTLYAVANLVAYSIHNVLTYNYDNLLENCLRDLGCDPDKIHSIVKEDMLRDFSNTDEWNIYHVHGRIPVDDAHEKMSGRVILTESDYYQEENINYSWTNVLQSYVIARMNVIYIGFSGADYNFRRIIKYMNQEGNEISHKRYIFFSVDDIANAVFSDKKTGTKKKIEKYLKDDKYAYEKVFINYLIHAQSVYWKEHGLDVIWSSHEELPGILMELSSAHV